MKIAQIYTLYHPKKGGIEIRIKETSERLVKMGMDVDVLCVDPTKTLPRNEVINGVNVKRFPTWVFQGRYYSPEMLRYLNKHADDYDILHAHNYHSFPALYAAKAKHRSKLVLTPSYHGKTQGLLRRMYLTFYQILWQRYIGKVDKFAYVSLSEWQSICKDIHLPAEKGVAMSNAANIGEIAAAQPYDVDFKLILNLGRIERYKNIHNIIEAMPYIDKEYKLYIIGNTKKGTSSYKTYLEELIQKLKLSDRVKILAGVEDDKAYRWYQTCSVFVTLSGLESFGRTVLEGLAAGKPVVASDIPAFKELAGKFEGIDIVKIPGTTPQKLADTIMEASKRSTPTNDLSEYTWDKISERLNLVYHQLLDRQA
jgi:glycosyltransferase involved in cell wall biosynthesis